MDAFENQGRSRALYHVSIGVSDIERARAFFAAMLGPLGYTLQWEAKESDKITALGWGLHFPELWTNIPRQGAAPHPGVGVHLCFHAPNRAAVDAFYRAALMNGGRDDGEPGYRPEYGPGYYAAFVLDLDDNRLEAMWYDHASVTP